MTDRIAAYYDRLALEHGHSPAAVDATDQAALDIRYQVLGDVCDMNGKRVLDVGCGYGGLGAYLTARYPRIDYLGIDVSNRLLDIGRQHNPGLDLRYGDLIATPGQYDIAVAQGIFYRIEGSAWDRTRMLIRGMWMKADAVAFTAISSWTLDTVSDEHLIHPVQTLEFCRTLTPWVTLRHDYHLGDICMYLYRKDSR